MYMFKYILKRIGLMLMTFAIIVSICFILIKLLPISFQAGFGQDKINFKSYTRQGVMTSQSYTNCLFM